MKYRKTNADGAREDRMGGFFAVKLFEWNLHKMTKDIQVKDYVIETISGADAEIVCLLEYLDDAGIKNVLSEKYWIAESNTKSGNKVLIAVKKSVVKGDIHVVDKDEVKDCYNFMRVDFIDCKDRPLSVIGIRMLSPINASLQTPKLNEYLNTIDNTYICMGDYNIRSFRMPVWFPGIPMETLSPGEGTQDLSEASIIYVDRNNRISGFGDVDHVLHSDDISVASEYKWDYLENDNMYPKKDDIVLGNTWKISAGFPDHAVMESVVTFHAMENSII